MVVGQIYQITQEWIAINLNIATPISSFYDGARVEIIEIQDGCATGIKFLDTNEVLFVDNSCVSHLVWCFFTKLEANRGYIKLVKKVLSK